MSGAIILKIEVEAPIELQATQNGVPVVYNGIGLPEGGLPGQVLAKLGVANFETTWKDANDHDHEIGDVNLIFENSLI